MFAGFLILLPVAYFNFGGLTFLQNNLPTNHLIWHGGQGAQYIIVWFFIALGTLIEPSFYQRCFAAKTEKVAQRGIFISILFWIFFDFLTTFTGLYARAILPNLTDPVTSYLALAQKLLPPVFLGIFLTGLLATIMSTIDSYSFLAAMTFGRDFLWRIKNEDTTDNIKKYTRLGLILSGILAIVIAYFAQSVIRIWKDLGSIGTPALVIPMAISFFPKLRMEKKFVIVSIIGSALISGMWVFSISFNGCEYLLGVEPIYPGLGFAFILFVISLLYKKFIFVKQ